MLYLDVLCFSIYALLVLIDVCSFSLVYVLCNINRNAIIDFEILLFVIFIMLFRRCALFMFFGACVGMSDVSSATPKAQGSLPIHENLSALQQRAHELKLELTRLRRLQVSNSSLTKDAINDVATKIKVS